MKMKNRTIFYVDLLALFPARNSVARGLTRDISEVIVGL